MTRTSKFLMYIDEFVTCSHLGERASFSYGTVCYAVQGGSKFRVCG